MFVLFLLFVFAFSKDVDTEALKILNSKEFQDYVDAQLKEMDKRLYEKKKVFAYKQAVLFQKLEKNMNSYTPDELAKSFADISNLTVHVWLDSRTYADRVYKNGKKIVFSYLIKDDDKMRKNLNNPVFKNTMKQNLEYTQNRLTCHHDLVLDRLFEEGYVLDYRYRYKSDGHTIMDIIISKKTCQKYKRW